MIYDFDYILDVYTGSSGRWHIQQYCLILLQSLANSVVFLIPMFSAYVPEHRCFVPSCDVNTTKFNESWVDIAIPKSSSGDDFLREGQALASCHMYPTFRPNDTCSAANFNTQETVKCDNFVYDRTLFEETLATRLDLVCSDSFKIELLNTVLMAGLMVGCLIGGPLGDKLGRKKTLVMADVILGPVTILCGFLPYYEAFLVLRLIATAAVSVMWIASHALLLELFGKNNRKLFYVCGSLFYGFGTLFLPLVAYFERDWKFIHLYLGLIPVVAAPILAIFMQESIRWMIVNGKSDEAEAVLIKIARENKRALLLEEVADIRTIIAEMATTAQANQETKLSPLTMFAPTYLCQTLVLLTMWVSSVAAFYSLTLNATNLAGDIFINFILSTLAEIPPAIYIITLLDRIGRRLSGSVALILLGATCVAMAFTPKGQSGTILALFLIGKFSSSASLNIAWFYTAELYPTNLRAQAVATCSLISRVFGMLAPFVSELGKFWVPLPLLVLGLPSAISGCLALIVLPETNGKDLLDVSEPSPVVRNDTKSIMLKVVPSHDHDVS